MYRNKLTEKHARFVLTEKTCCRCDFTEKLKICESRLFKPETESKDNNIILERETKFFKHIDFLIEFWTEWQPYPYDLKMQNLISVPVAWIRPGGTLTDNCDAFSWRCATHAKPWAPLHVSRSQCLGTVIIIECHLAIHRSEKLARKVVQLLTEDSRDTYLAQWSQNQTEVSFGILLHCGLNLEY